jgi:hypothetical protein
MFKLVFCLCLFKNYIGELFLMDNKKPFNQCKSHTHYCKDCGLVVLFGDSANNEFDYMWWCSNERCENSVVTYTFYDEEPEWQETVQKYKVILEFEAEFHKINDKPIPDLNSLRENLNDEWNISHELWEINKYKGKHKITRCEKLCFMKKLYNTAKVKIEKL